MPSLKSFMKLFFFKYAVPAAFFFLLTGCSVDTFEQGSSGLSSEESIIAGQIIGESVSENQNGLLSSFPEAFAVPSASNLVAGTSPLSTESFRNLENYRYAFDAATGIHLASFSRQENTATLTSSSADTLTYLFYDRNQNIIELPVERQDDIEAVEFSATRSGDIQASGKESFFTRTDRFFIDGLSAESNILTIDGFHSGEGFFTLLRADGSELQREYLLDINFLDIRIDKAIVSRNRNFRDGVTGAFSYEATIRQTANGTDAQTKTVNGTVELNGDGTALLKFRDLFNTFRLRLDDGEVFDEDEFEGRVTQVSLPEQVFTLSNGQRIEINDATELVTDDFNSLEEVAAAVSQGVRVTAEGEYVQPDENMNRWVAMEVEFELESSDFEDILRSVDVSQNSFTLLNGDVFFITEASEIEFDTFQSLQQVADAVNAGLPVLAEGEFFIDTDSGNRIVEEVEFESDLREFDEDVIAVDLAERSFTLTDGIIININAQTMIDEEGEYRSLEEVAEALSNGEEVEARGTYYDDPVSGLRIAVEVEFED
jgi:hypothetical protein